MRRGIENWLLKLILARECLRLSQRHSGVRNFPEIKKIDDYKSDELVQIFIGLTIKIAELIISNIYFYLLLYEVKFPIERKISCNEYRD